MPYYPFAIFTSVAVVLAGLAGPVAAQGAPAHASVSTSVREVTSTRPPTIIGSAEFGSVLRGDTGKWSPNSVSVTRRWLADGEPISGAIGMTYVPVAGDVGKKISFRVTASKPRFGVRTATSASTSAVAAVALTAMPVPTISGETSLGAVLTANSADWEPAPVDLSYQWLRDGVVIPGATSDTHTIVSGDGAAELSVTVRGSKPGFIDSARTSAGIQIPDFVAIKNDRALRTFRAALADADNSPVDIFVGPGDSGTEGYGSTSIAKRFVSVLADELRAGHQPAGVPGGRGYVDPLNSVGFPDYPITTLNPAGVFTIGLGRQSLALWNPTQTITINDTFTDLDILYTGMQGTGSGYFSYTVDGGTPVYVDTGNKDVSHAGYTYRIGGLSHGSHEVVISGVTTTVASIIEGVMIYDGDADRGIRVWEGGANGATATAYAPPELLWAQSLQAVHPDLVVLPIGSNDFARGETAADTKARIEAIIGSIRANVDTDPSIVLLAYPARTDTTGTEDWDAYLAMYDQIAAADPDITVFDTGPLFAAQRSTGPSLISADEVHPTDAGYQLIGSALAAFLAP